MPRAVAEGKALKAGRARDRRLGGFAIGAGPGETRWFAAVWIRVGSRGCRQRHTGFRCERDFSRFAVESPRRRVAVCHHPGWGPRYFDRYDGVVACAPENRNAPRRQLADARKHRDLEALAREPSRERE